MRSVPVGRYRGSPVPAPRSFFRFGVAHPAGAAGVDPQQPAARARRQFLRAVDSERTCFFGFRVGAVRDVALDTARRAPRRPVGDVAIGKDGVAACGVGGGAEVARVAEGAPGRDLGDEVRRVFVFDVPVVFGRVDVLGFVALHFRGFGDFHARGRARFDRDGPQEPVHAVAVRVVAGAAGQRDGVAVVHVGADRAIAPIGLARFFVDRVGRSDRGAGAQNRNDAAGVGAFASLAGRVGGVDQGVFEAAAAQGSGRAGPLAVRIADAVHLVGARAGRRGAVAGGAG